MGRYRNAGDDLQGLLWMRGMNPQDVQAAIP